MTSDRWIDRPGPVRAGEEIAEHRLAAYLETVLPDVELDDIDIEQYPSGYSNLTYLVRAGPRALILRRPPPGVEIATAHDMGREFRILEALRPVYEKVPEPLAYCEDATVIGTPFYLMERVEGVILRKGMPDAMVPAPALTTAIAHELVGTLAELHAVDYDAAGLAALGRPSGYVGRQIEGWTKRYARAETDPVPEAAKVSGWLRDSLPPDTDPALIHNDFKHDNVVLDPRDWSRVVAILDWEMATLGDPQMDLGTSLAYWIEPSDPPELLRARLSPTTLPGTPGRRDMVERYARASGRDVDRIVFYYAYGLFKVAVIVQQLYARYVSGRTDDPRYAKLIDGVRALCGVAWQSIQKNRIDDLH